MSDCPNHILSNCLNPRPIETSSWKSIAKTVLNGAVDGGKQIFLGVVVDTFWGSVNGVNGHVKYWLGFTKKPENITPYSFSGLFRTYEWSFNDNPVTRVADSGSRIVLGLVNTLTGGYTHIIFNEHLKMGIESFVPPPALTDIRGMANWVTTGVFALSGAAALVRGGSAPVTVIRANDVKPTAISNSPTIVPQPSFAASVSEIGAKNGTPVPLPMRPDAIRPPRLPEVIVPSEPVPVVVKPAPKATPTPKATPELPPAISKPLPKVYEPHQVVPEITSAVESLESAFWHLVRGQQETLKVFEKEQLAAKILEQDKFEVAKAAQELKRPKISTEAFERVRRSRENMATIKKLETGKK